MGLLDYPNFSIEMEILSGRPKNAENEKVCVSWVE